MELSRAKANRVCQENTLVIANTLFQQHEGRLYTWTSPDGQHQNQIVIFFAAKMKKQYTVSKNKTRSWLWLRTWTAAADKSLQSCLTLSDPMDCSPPGSSVHGILLLIAKFRLKLKKVEKTTRLIRNDLNQIPYNYKWKWEIDSRD